MGFSPFELMSSKIVMELFTPPPVTPIAAQM